MVPACSPLVDQAVCDRISWLPLHDVALRALVGQRDGRQHVGPQVNAKDGHHAQRQGHAGYDVEEEGRYFWNVRGQRVGDRFLEVVEDEATCKWTRIFVYLFFCMSLSMVCGLLILIFKKSFLHLRDFFSSGKGGSKSVIPRKAHNHQPSEQATLAEKKDEIQPNDLAIFSAIATSASLLCYGTPSVRNHSDDE